MKRKIKGGIFMKLKEKLTNKLYYRLGLVFLIGTGLLVGTKTIQFVQAIQPEVEDNIVVPWVESMKETIDEKLAE